MPDDDVSPASRPIATLAPHRSKDRRHRGRGAQPALAPSAERPPQHCLSARHRPAPKRARAASSTWPYEVQPSAASRYVSVAGPDSPFASCSTARAVASDNRCRAVKAFAVPTSRSAAARFPIPAHTRTRSARKCSRYHAVTSAARFDLLDQLGDLLGSSSARATHPAATAAGTRT